MMARGRGEADPDSSYFLVPCSPQGRRIEFPSMFVAIRDLSPPRNSSAS